jgi:hypothetical protein
MMPRLLATMPPDGIIEDMRAALSARYGEDFVRVTAALYRNSNDSVAWHGDTTARDLEQAVPAARRGRHAPATGAPSRS